MTYVIDVNTSTALSTASRNALKRSQFRRSVGLGKKYLLKHRVRVRLADDVRESACQGACGAVIIDKVIHNTTGGR